MDLDNKGDKMKTVIAVVGLMLIGVQAFAYSYETKRDIFGNYQTTTSSGERYTTSRNVLGNWVTRES